jgi:hypothetical protein
MSDLRTYIAVICSLQLDTRQRQPKYFYIVPSHQQSAVLSSLFMQAAPPPAMRSTVRSPNGYNIVYCMAAT